MDAIWQKIFSSAFSWMKMFEFRLKFHWSLFLRVQLTIFQYWFRLWLGAVQATSHYLNQWWLVYRHIYASPDLNEFMKSVQLIWRSDNSNMIASNGNIFHVTGPLCGESTSHLWISLTKAGDAELWFFSLICTRTNSSVNNWAPVIWDTIALIMTSL